jgi:hypothetical protein
MAAVEIAVGLALVVRPAFVAITVRLLLYTVKLVFVEPVPSDIPAGASIRNELQAAS